MVRSVVVKLGGSVLRDAEAIGEAAGWVKRMAVRGVGVVVVVSALKGVTDDLQRAVKNLSDNPDPALMAEILSMGERTSARLFALALKEHGVNAMFIDPADKLWPVVAEGNPLDAEPVYEETRKRVVEGLIPLLASGVTPVVCGFLGVNRDGRVVTLGRGGSDTTAVLLGSCLGSEEIVLVKDVPGVFSADPDVVGDAELVDALDFKEAQALVKGGAKIIHTKALRYLGKGLRLRVASLKELVTGGGTVIEGYERELEVKVSPSRISMVTVVGDGFEGAGLIGRLSKRLGEEGVKVIASTSEERSIILYVEEVGGLVEKLHKILVDERVGKALSVYEGLAMITVSGRMLETSPGVIYRVIKPLAEAGINVYGLLTISSSIRVLVSGEDAEKARVLIRNALEEVSTGEEKA